MEGKKGRAGQKPVLRRAFLGERVPSVTSEGPFRKGKGGGKRSCGMQKGIRTPYERAVGNREVLRAHSTGGGEKPHLRPSRKRKSGIATSPGEEGGILCSSKGKEEEEKKESH